MLDPSPTAPDTGSNWRQAAAHPISAHGGTPKIGMSFHVTLLEKGRGFQELGHHPYFGGNMCVCLKPQGFWHLEPPGKCNSFLCRRCCRGHTTGAALWDISVSGMDVLLCVWTHTAVCSVPTEGHVLNSPSASPFMLSHPCRRYYY